MEHSFSYTDEITFNTLHTVRQKDDTLDQRLFDWDAKTFENALSEYDLDIEQYAHPELERTIKKYQQAKADYRESLGSAYVNKQEGTLRTTYKKHQEDHIGALLICDNNNRLAALYCEDSSASVVFCTHLVRKYEPFELSPLHYPHNNSQMALIYSLL